MNNLTLAMENEVYVGTRGVSENSDAEFRPAFLSELTGRIELAKQRDGAHAPCHFISRLPREWAAEFNDDGSIKNLKNSIISGFEIDGVFYTRDEAAEL